MLSAKNQQTMRLQTNYNAEALDIVINFGGSIHPLRPKFITQEVRFAIQANPDPAEVERLFFIIDRIAQIHVDPEHVQKKAIQRLINFVGELLELSCISPQQKEFIKSHSRCFFNNLIQNMPANFVRPGCPGRRYYRHQLEHIDAVLSMVNVELSKINIIFANRPLAIELPRESSHDVNVFVFGGLPRDLQAFIHSIDLFNPNCMAVWENWFKNCSAVQLSSYLNQVTISIQQKNDSREVHSIVERLHAFIAQLKTNQQPENIIAMFSDVANFGDRTPLGRAESLEDITPREEISPAETIAEPLDIGLRKRAECNGLLDNLIVSKLTFNKDFAAFRQMLSTILEEPSIQERFFLTALQSDFADKSASSKEPHVKTLNEYLARCVYRVSRPPLSDDLLTQFESLLERYDDSHNLPFDPRKKHKHEFLTLLKNNITIYPEKTYADCFRLTRDKLNQHKRHVVEHAEKKTTTFFKNHRFKNFIHALINSEPDYEHTHPCSEATSTLSNRRA